MGQVFAKPMHSSENVGNVSFAGYFPASQATAVETTKTRRWRQFSLVAAFAATTVAGVSFAVVKWALPGPKKLVPTTCRVMLSDGTVVSSGNIRFTARSGPPVEMLGVIENGHVEKLFTIEENSAQLPDGRALPGEYDVTFLNMRPAIKPRYTKKGALSATVESHKKNEFTFTLEPLLRGDEKFTPPGPEYLVRATCSVKLSDGTAIASGGICFTSRIGPPISMIGVIEKGHVEELFAFNEGEGGAQIGDGGALPGEYDVTFFDTQPPVNLRYTKKGVLTATVESGEERKNDFEFVLKP